MIIQSFLFLYYKEKQAVNWNLLFSEMGLRRFLMVLLICNINFIITVYAIIRFDCGSNQSNITLSLLEVGECDLRRSQVHVERTFIQFYKINVTICKLGTFLVAPSL